MTNSSERRPASLDTYVCFDVGDLAHTGNDSAHRGIVENETQRHFRHSHLRRDERLERISALDAWDQVFRHKIGTAPIVSGPTALLCEAPGERSFIKAERERSPPHSFHGRPERDSSSGF
ncbi:MAG: hypothetical protein WKF84_08155 [Pyrinomonadaceae bacterium]